MNGSTLTLGIVGALAAAGALSRRGSRSEKTWYVHGTRADLAKEIVSSGVMRGSESHKFGNREVVFAAEQSERARDAVNAWASARYNVHKNPGKGGTAVVRFRASRPPDWTGKGEAAWMGDLVIEDAHIVDEKSQQALKRQAEDRWGRGSRAKTKVATLTLAAPPALERAAPGLGELRAAMVQAAREDTAYGGGYADRDDPLALHCGPVSYVVQRRYGGSIMGARVQGEPHLWNRLPDGTEVDLSGSQYGGDGWTPLVKGRTVAPRKGVNPRFALFERRVEATSLNG